MTILKNVYLNIFFQNADEISGNFFLIFFQTMNNLSKFIYKCHKYYLNQII